MRPERAQLVNFDEASASSTVAIYVGACILVGVDVEEDKSSAAVAYFVLSDTSQGVPRLPVALIANEVQHLHFPVGLWFPTGIWLKTSPTGEFTGTLNILT
jgi:hypothetical protein